MEFHYLLKHKKENDYDNKLSRSFQMLSNSKGEPIVCLDDESVVDMLKYLFEYHKLSNCTKTKVACVLYDEQMKEYAAGVNYVFGVEECNVEECKKDFSQKPKHRHGICKAIHSEVLALRNWYGGTIEKTPHHAFVTRYPCEDCVSKMSTLGVKIIYYSNLDSNGHFNLLDESNLEYLEDKYSVIIRSYSIYEDIPVEG